MKSSIGEAGALCERIPCVEKKPAGLIFYGQTSFRSKLGLYAT